jgi:hypothetical protein
MHVNLFFDFFYKILKFMSFQTVFFAVLMRHSGQKLFRENVKNFLEILNFCVIKVVFGYLFHFMQKVFIIILNHKQIHIVVVIGAKRPFSLYPLPLFPYLLSLIFSLIRQSIPFLLTPVLLSLTPVLSSLQLVETGA